MIIRFLNEEINVTKPIRVTETNEIANCVGFVRVRSFIYNP